MHNHLLDNEITRNYVYWLMQEEYEFDELENFSDESHMDDDIQGMLHDAFGVSNIDNSVDCGSSSHV